MANTSQTTLLVVLLAFVSGVAVIKGWDYVRKLMSNYNKQKRNRKGSGSKQVRFEEEEGFTEIKGNIDVGKLIEEAIEKY